MNTRHVSSDRPSSVYVDGTLSGELVEPPPKEHFHLFLLGGQSNMAGRGLLTPEDQTPDPRVYALSQDGVWAPAVDPIHWDKPQAGVGLGRSFGIALAHANPEITIGLIPAACGGSPIEAWTPGGYHGQTQSHPYDDAIVRTRRALADGALRGILWHQGESDADPELAPAYRDKLARLIARFRAAFGQPTLPFLIGQLGRFPETPWHAAKAQVDAAHRELAAELPRVGFVSSAGLTCLPDGVHFDALSLRTFGRRYAQVYQGLVGMIQASSD